VFPHRALPADSLPQSGLRVQRGHARLRAPNEARPFDLNVATPLSTPCPRVARPLAATMHPCAQEPHGAGEELLQAGVVAVHAIVAVVAPPFRVQLLEPVPHPAAPRFPAPGGAPLARVPPFLARWAALQRGLARTVDAPAALNAEAVNAGAASGLLATKRQHPRLVRCHCQPTLAQPGPQRSGAGLGVGLLLNRGAVLIRGADQTRRAATAGRDHLLNPPVEGLVPIHVGPGRREDAAVRGPGRRMNALASGRQPPGLEPLPHQPPQRPVLQAFLPHPAPPVVSAVVNEPLEVRFDHDVVRPKLALDRPLSHRGHGPTVGPIPLATAQAVRRIEGCEDPRDRTLPPRVFPGGPPERTAVAVAFRDIAPRDACGSGALPRESLAEVAAVRLQRRLVRFRADVIHAVRRLRPEVAPARSKIRRIAPLIAVAKPRLRLLSGLRRYALQAG
jgi:hypothetical protein